MSDTQMQALQKEVHEIAIKVAKGEQDHKNLKEMLEKHIENSEKWREQTDAQMQAIANSLLQEQTRDEVEDAYEEKQEQKQESWNNKKIILWTTAVLAVATLLTNFQEIIGLIKRALAVF